MPVVLLLLGKVLLDLLDVLVAFRGWGENCGNFEGNELWIGGLSRGLELFEDIVVLDGLVDRRGREKRVEAAASGCGIVFVDDGLRHRLLRERLALLCGGAFFGPVVVDVEAEDVSIFDRVRNRVGVKLFLKEILGGSKSGDVTLDLLHCGIVLEDRGTREAEELGVRKKLLDSPVVLTELRAVALVEDEDHPLVAQLFKPLLER